MRPAIHLLSFIKSRLVWNICPLPGPTAGNGKIPGLPARLAQAELYHWAIDPALHGRKAKQNQHDNKMYETKPSNTQNDSGKPWLLCYSLKDRKGRRLKTQEV